MEVAVLGQTRVYLSLSSGTWDLIGDAQKRVAEQAEDLGTFPQ